MNGANQKRIRRRESKRSDDNRKKRAIKKSGQKLNITTGNRKQLKEKEKVMNNTKKIGTQK